MGFIFDISIVISGDVVTGDVNTTFRNVLHDMHEKIGSVIVTNSGYPVGIFTERDLVVRALYSVRGIEVRLRDVSAKHLLVTDEQIDGKDVDAAMVSRRVVRLL